jgi:hypothetical protein
MLIVRALLMMLVCAVPAVAQTLDVGGFDVRLGESFAAAAGRLSVVYELQNLPGLSKFGTGGKVWWIRRKDADRTILGELDEKDGNIVGITRQSSGDAYQLSRDYVSYWREAQRAAGGVDCTTEPDFVADPGGNVPTRLTGYTTTCGRYRVSYGVLWEQRSPHETLSISVW